METVKCRRCAFDMKKVDGYRNEWCPPCRLEDAVLSQIIGTDDPGGGDSVLDVGSGLAHYHRALHEKVGSNMILLDAHAPYMKAHRIPENTVQLIGDARRILPLLGSRSIDVVMGLDFPEHLPPQDAIDVVEDMQRIAARKVVLFVPEGYHPQDEDAYKLEGDHWQRHRSTWAYHRDASGLFLEVWPSGEDPAGNPNVNVLHLGSGWTVASWDDFHAHHAEENPGVSAGALFMVWTRG